MSDELRSKITLTTPVAILSYPNLFEPRSVQGGDPKYSAVFVFPAEDTEWGEVTVPAADLTEMKRAAIEVGQARFGPDFVQKVKKGKLRWPFRGAGEPGPDDAEDIEAKGYPEGSVFVNCNRDAERLGKPHVFSRIEDPATGKPAVIVDAQGTVRMSDGTSLPTARPVYGGALAIGLLTAYAYDGATNKGVTFGLDAVQVRDDGLRLDGRTSGADVFEADAEAPDLSDVIGDSEDEQFIGASAGADEEDPLADLM